MYGPTMAAVSGYNLRDDAHDDERIFAGRGSASRKPFGVWASLVAVVVGVLLVSDAAPASAAASSTR
jgi:hypothetical protein